MIILTGSEDSFLKVSLYDPNLNNLSPLHTFSNHVASVRSISKILVSVDPTTSTREYLVLSAGSRMQAHIYRASYSLLNDCDFTMSHLCHFMNSFE